ncbi:MAG TPA: hypothetical protein DEB40_03390 [Elusimicrobia bacterium]|nr:hypothetical protein [Elusimicrobiota bacterium]HBT60772.1 hypothetical protein [Elusimicrobiota bacterium]
MTIELRLLTDTITIKKPVQTFAPATKQPVFEYQLVAEHVKARFNPVNTDLKPEGGLLGRIPKKRFKLFLNPTELKENYEVIDEATGRVHVVTEVKDYFGHHMEASVEEKK